MERYKTITQLSEMTGLDRRTIKLKLQSIDVEKIEGKAKFFDMHLALPLIYKPEDPDNEQHAKNMRDVEYRVEQGRAIKLELENARIRNEQIPIEDVATIVEREYAAVRAQLIAIPIKVCLELSVIEDPAIIQNKLQDAINEALVELTSDQTFLNNQVPVIEEPSDELSIDSEIDVVPKEVPKTKTKNKSRPVG